MKKFLTYTTLLSAVTLSSQCLAYDTSLTEKPLEMARVSIVKNSAVTEEEEIALWQELTIYSLIAGIYSAYWVRQKR